MTTQATSKETSLYQSSEVLFFEHLTALTIMATCSETEVNTFSGVFPNRLKFHSKETAEVSLTHTQKKRHKKSHTWLVNCNDVKTMISNIKRVQAAVDVDRKMLMELK